MSSSMNGSTGLRGPTGKVGNKVPSGYKSGQLAQFTPEQMSLFQQLFSNVGPESYLSKLAGGDESQFEAIEAPAKRQFSAQLGNLASRFSGMGGLGARRSSGFQNTATAASSNFAQELQAQRQELQRQALMDLMGISQNLLGQRPYEQYLVPKQRSSGFLGSLFGSAPKETLGAISGGFQGAIGGGMAGGFPGAALGGLGGLLKGFL